MGSNNSFISLLIFLGYVFSSCTSKRNLLHKSYIGNNIPYLNSLPRGGGGKEGGWFGKKIGGGDHPEDGEKKDQSPGSFWYKNELSEENQYRQAPSLPYNEGGGNGFDGSSHFIPPPPPPPYEEEGENNNMNYNEKYRNPSVREMDGEQALENDYYTPQSQGPYSQNNYTTTMPPQPPPYYYPPAPQQQQYYPYQGEHQYMQEENYYQQQHQDELFNAQIRNLQTQISNYTSILSQLQTENEEQQGKIESLEQDLTLKKNLSETEVVIKEQFKVHIIALEAEIQDYQSQIIKLNQTIQQEIEVNNIQLEEYKELLKRKEEDMEELAFLIEQKQWAEQRNDNQNNIAEKRNKKSAGFFTWMTSIFFGNKEESDEQSDDERMQSSLSHAKSALLNALQIERESVLFLENFIIDLEQNITSLSSIIKSKSYIISELNSRIDVFEEDKLMLKGALKQLQKETKVEVNKQEILREEVSEKEDEIEQLQEEIHKICMKNTMTINKLLTEKRELEKSTLMKSEETRQIHYYVDILEGQFDNLLLDSKVLKERCQELEEIVHKMEEVNQQNLYEQSVTDITDDIHSINDEPNQEEDLVLDEEEYNDDADALEEEEDIIILNPEDIGKVVQEESHFKTIKEENEDLPISQYDSIRKEVVEVESRNEIESYKKENGIFLISKHESIIGELSEEKSIEQQDTLKKEGVLFVSKDEVGLKNESFNAEPLTEGKKELLVSKYGLIGGECAEEKNSDDVMTLKDFFSKHAFIAGNVAEKKIDLAGILEKEKDALLVSKQESAREVQEGESNDLKKLEKQKEESTGSKDDPNCEEVVEEESSYPAETLNETTKLLIFKDEEGLDKKAGEIRTEVMTVGGAVPILAPWTDKKESLLEIANINEKNAVQESISSLDARAFTSLPPMTENFQGKVDSIPSILPTERFWTGDEIDNNKPMKIPEDEVKKELTTHSICCANSYTSSTMPTTEENVVLTQSTTINYGHVTQAGQDNQSIGMGQIHEQAQAEDGSVGMGIDVLTGVSSPFRTKIENSLLSSSTTLIDDQNHTVPSKSKDEDSNHIPTGEILSTSYEKHKIVGRQNVLQPFLKKQSIVVTALMMILAQLLSLIIFHLWLPM